MIGKVGSLLAVPTGRASGPSAKWAKRGRPPAPSSCSSSLPPDSPSWHSRASKTFDADRRSAWQANQSKLASDSIPADHTLGALAEWKVIDPAKLVDHSERARALLARLPPIDWLAPQPLERLTVALVSSSVCQRASERRRKRKRQARPEPKRAINHWPRKCNRRARLALPLGRPGDTRRASGAPQLSSARPGSARLTGPIVHCFRA